MATQTGEAIPRYVCVRVRVSRRMCVCVKGGVNSKAFRRGGSSSDARFYAHLQSSLDNI